MEKAYRNSAEALAERALKPSCPPQENERPAPRQSEPSDPTPTRRLIYSGTMPPPEESEARTRATLPPRNRRISKRKVSPFNIILILIGFAAAIVLYIGNIIAVDQLMNDIHKEEVKLQKILNEQEMLKARINQMSSLERIRARAEEELGLQNPKQAPLWLPVDPEKVRDAEQAAGQPQ